MSMDGTTSSTGSIVCRTRTTCPVSTSSKGPPIPDLPTGPPVWTSYGVGRPLRISLGLWQRIRCYIVKVNFLKKKKLFPIPGQVTNCLLALEVPMSWLPSCLATVCITHETMLKTCPIVRSFKRLQLKESPTILKAEGGWASGWKVSRRSWQL